MIRAIRNITWTPWRRIAAGLILVLAIALLIHECLIPVKWGHHFLSSGLKFLALFILTWLCLFWDPNPLTKKKLLRFRSIKRGYWSFMILTVLIVLSVFAELVINNRAVVVYHEGELHFPTYTGILTGDDFGLDYPWEVNYRELKEHFEAEDDGSWMLMPLVPWNPYETDERDDRKRHPLPPDLSRMHLLGTDKLGQDVFARLFYGFRISIICALIYLLGVNLLGVAIGAAMGYFGGWVDLIGQRLVEIWANIPFLYIVIIMVAYIPVELPVSMRVGLIVFVMILFSWTSLALYLRTSTFKEKVRDYTAAARLLGASTPRIIFVHILPNSVATIVTFIPFTVAGVITALTALDYLGFGIPAAEPSWGELLRQGTEYLHAPWIVSSAFGAMVFVLTLVTFIGEAVREAFDPKKFTIYR